jgi:hypothetical protein
VGAGDIAPDALDGRAIDMQGQVLARPEIRDFSETTATPVVSGGTLTLDLEAASVFDAMLSADVTTFILANPPPANKAGSATLILRQDSVGGRTVIWPDGIRWPGGTPPDTSAVANAVDVLTFVTVDGGTTGTVFSPARAFPDARRLARRAPWRHVRGRADLRQRGSSGLTRTSSATGSSRTMARTRRARGTPP